MAVTPVRIALLGTGTMAVTHLAAWAGIDGAQVTAVIGRDAARAATLAASCQARGLTTLRDALQSDAVDAVDICLPSAMHPEVAIAALALGKHVFCETPMALDLDAAKRMRDAARRADRLLQIGLLMRSVAAYQHIKATTVAGAHGRLLSLATWRLGTYLRAGAADRKAHYGDPSTELMTFDFDLVQWLLGTPVRLAASATRTAAGDPGEISAVLDYGDGRHATVLASGLMPRGARFTVGCRALFDAAAFELRTEFAEGPPRSRFTMVTDDAPPRPVAIADRDPFELELRRFIDCIHGRADPRLLDAERAIEALVLSTATQWSLAQSRAIEIAAVG